MEQEKYDVVVVGSGIGGLCAGALLARRGYKTLVVEKRSRIGGRCSTEEYEGFKLPTGAMAMHKGAGMEETFHEAGAELELVMVPRLFYRLGGKDYEMPAKGSIAAMFSIINMLEADRAKVAGHIAKEVAVQKIGEALGRGFREPEKETMVFQDWLLQYTNNELAHDIFDTIASVLLAAHTFEIPASAVFAFFLKQGGSREVGVAPYGNLVEIEKLEKVVKTNGDVWTDCPAKRIVIEGGSAKGVVVEKDGSELEITSQVVISDIGPKATVELAGDRSFDEEYLRMVRLRNRTQPVTIAFVASDRPLWPESGEPAILMLTGTRRIKSIIPMSSIAPELAPPGQHLLFAYCSPRTSFMNHMDIEEEVRQVRLDLSEQLPGLEKYGRILRIDPRDIDHEFTGSRARIGSGMPIETPTKNLFNVGDGCYAPGLNGTTGAVDSAQRVVETVKKRFKPGKA
jgi:phytoene dehydrogenase-like protein